MNKTTEPTNQKRNLEKKLVKKKLGEKTDDLFGGRISDRDAFSVDGLSPFAVDEELPMRNWDCHD